MTTIDTPTSGDEELKSRLEGLTDEQKDKLLKMLKQDKLDREKSMGNIDAILEDLKENYVNIEEYKEMLNKPGDIIHINLPAIGKFNGFKFDCFMSNYLGSVKLKDWNEEYKEKSYSMEEILKLYEAIIKYMKEYGVDADDADEYDAREYLFTILGGDDRLHNANFRLKDEDKYGLPINRMPYSKYHPFYITEPKYPNARLLLKPSK